MAPRRNRDSRPCGATPARLSAIRAGISPDLPQKDQEAGALFLNLRLYPQARGAQ